MENIEFSQDELKLLMAVLNQVNLKLVDAELIIPIARKIMGKIKQEEKKEVFTADPQTKN